MSRKTLPLVLVLLSCLAGPRAFGQDPSEEERRAEAAKTILRRFSATEGAKTAELGLPAEGAAFVDLYLDVRRNLREIRARRAPRSRMFFGTPHAVWKEAEGAVAFHADFVTFTLASVTLPFDQAPAVLEAALGEAFAKAAALPSDGAEEIQAWRLSLAMELVVQCDRAKAPFLGAEKGKALLARLRAAALENLDKVSPRDIHPLLMFLRSFGDDGTAEAFIARIEALPEGSDPNLRATYVGTVCGMRCPAAAAYLLKQLGGGDPAAKAAAAGAVLPPADDAVLDLLEKILAVDSGEEENVRSRSLNALERVRSDRAVAIMTTLFEETKSDPEKFRAACALARVGRDTAVPYLREKLAGFEAEGKGGRTMGMANMIRRLLEELEAGKKD